MKCPECKGELVIRIAFPHTDKCTLPCTRCNSTGEVPEEMTQWIEDGKIIKDKRIAKRITLRDTAKKISQADNNTILMKNVLKLSSMERGIIKPDMNIYDNL